MTMPIGRRTLYRFVPRGLISRLARRAYRSRASCLLINPFIRRYGVNKDELAKPAEAYRSLADFFCRAINLELRPIVPGDHILTAAADGRIAEYGRITEGRLIQAKGIDYTTAGLLGEEAAARCYEGGFYITTYLSPADYHRVHFPSSGTVLGSTRIHGARWPVNESGVRGIPRLFEKNERMITYLDTPRFGRVAIVKVGAYIVGGIAITYKASPDGRSGCRGSATDRSSRGIAVLKGGELGWFEFGSTVILLIAPGPYSWSISVNRHLMVRMGQAILEREQ